MWAAWVFAMGNAAGTPKAALAAVRAAADPSAAGALVEMGTRVGEYLRGLPLRPGTTPLKFAPDYEAWLIEAMRHGDYDDFWKNHGASVVDHLPEYKDIPVYHVTGWYDSWARRSLISTTSSCAARRRVCSGSSSAPGRTADKRAASPAMRSSPPMPPSTSPRGDCDGWTGG